MEMLSRTIAVMFAVLCVLSEQHVLGQDLFSAPRTYFDNRRIVASGDLDGDGDIDLVYLRPLAATEAGIELNNGSGGFTQGGVISIADLRTSSPGVLLDVTGDGALDFAVATQNPTPGAFDLTVYAGDGAGGFPTRQSFALTSALIEVAVGDGNADGRDDLLLRLSGASSNSPTLFQWVFTSPSGLLTFGPQAAGPPATSFGASLEAQDLNGDGRADFVTRNDFLVPAVMESWFTQSGGMIAAGPSIQLPPAFASLGGDISMGDLDTDGDIDILIASSFVGQLNILLWINDGIGNLSAAPSQQLFIDFSNAQDVALLDLDLDGDLDLVHRAITVNIFGGSSGGYTFFENNGLGGFTKEGQWPHGQGNGLSIAPTDLDGDGASDYIGPNEVFLSRGSLSPFGQTLPPLTRARLFDQDGDGDFDFNILSSLSAFINDGTGVLSTSISEHISIPAGVPGFLDLLPYSVDLDGDGDQDVLTSLYASGSQGSIFIQHEQFRNDGGAEFIPMGPLLTTPSVFLDLMGNNLGVGRPRGVRPDRQVRDMDGNGLLDLVHYDSVYLRLANGRLAPPPSPSFGPWRAIDTFDVDSDGDTDVLGIPTNVGTIASLAVLNNDGAANFTASVLPGVNLGTGLATVGDIDGDGDEDIVAFSTIAPTNLMIFVNNGGTLAAPIIIPLFTGHAARNLQVADVNSDGRADIIMSQIDSPFGMRWSTIVWFQSATPIVFEPAAYFNAGRGNRAVDIDGDGDLDLVGLSSVFNQSITPPASGSRRQFGTGLPGGDGLIPLIGATGPFRAGETGVLKLSGVPGGVAAILAFGAQESNQPIPSFPGAFAYGAPWSILFPLTMPGTAGTSGAGNLDIPAFFPPSLANTTTYLQAAYADPLAPMGLSLTGGLELIIGP